MAFTVCVVSSQSGDGKSRVINQILNANMLPSFSGIQSVTTMVTLIKHHDAPDAWVAGLAVDASDLETDDLSGRFKQGVLDGIVSRVVDSWSVVEARDCARVLEKMFETRRVRLGAAAVTSTAGHVDRKRSRPETTAAACDDVAAPLRAAGSKVEIAVVLTRACPEELCVIEVPDGIGRRECYATIAGGCDAVLWCSTRLVDMTTVLSDYVQRCPSAYSPVPAVPQVLACAMRLWTSEQGKFDDDDMRVQCLRKMRGDFHPLAGVHGGGVFMRDSADSLLGHCAVMDMATPEKAATSVRKLVARMRAARDHAQAGAEPGVEAEADHPGFEVAWQDIKRAVAHGETHIIVWVNARMGDGDLMDDREKKRMLGRVWHRFVLSSAELIEAKVQVVLQLYCVHALARVLGVNDSRVTRRAWQACKSKLEEGVDYRALVPEVFGQDVKRLIQDASAVPASVTEGCDDVRAIRAALEPAIRTFEQECSKGRGSSD